MSVIVIVRVINSKSDALPFVSLSNGTDLDLGGTMGGETGKVLVLSVVVFSSVERNPSYLPIFVFISNIFLSLPSLFSHLFPNAISL